MVGLTTKIYSGSPRAVSLAEVAEPKPERGAVGGSQYISLAQTFTVTIYWTENPPENYWHRKNKRMQSYTPGDGKRYVFSPEPVWNEHPPLRLASPESRTIRFECLGRMTPGRKGPGTYQPHCVTPTDYADIPPMGRLGQQQLHKAVHAALETAIGPLTLTPFHRGIIALDDVDVTLEALW